MTRISGWYEPSWGCTLGNDYRYYGLADVKPELLVLSGCKLVAIDTEYHSTGDQIPVWLSIAYSPTDSFGFSLLPPSSDIPWELLRDPSVTKLMHNAPADLHVLREWDIDLTNIIDTAVMCRMALIPANLEDACEAMGTLTRPRHMKDVWVENHVNNSIDLGEELNAIKCGQDTLGTFQLYLELIHQGVEHSPIDMDYVRSEMEIIPILETMSRRGIKLDQDIREVLDFSYGYQLEQLESICRDEFGFSPHSNQQVAVILTKRGNFLPRSKSRKRFSFRTDRKVMEKILPLEPLAGLILESRKLRKLRGTYLVPLKDRERIYTYFHLDASTARISSSGISPSERNLQNIPKVDKPALGMRSMFIPDNGWFTDMDFSQIELRVMAYIANDRRMMEELDRPGGDLHQATADYLHIPRRVAKNCTFAIIYGATAQTVMETAHISDLRLAERMLQQIFRLYPGMGDWIRSTQEFGVVHGYVETIDGRKISVVRPSEEITDDDDDRTIFWKTAGIQRKSSNYPIQASAAEIMKKALKVAARKSSLPLAHQVHDQILWDGIAGTREEIQGWMDNIAPFNTPVNVEYTERWT